MEVGVSQVLILVFPGGVEAQALEPSSVGFSAFSDILEQPGLELVLNGMLTLLVGG